MKKIRNILSIALVFVMLIGFAPVNVFAEENVPAAADVTPVDNANVPAGQGTDPAGSNTGDNTGTPGASTDPNQNPQQPQVDPLKDKKGDAIAALAGLKFLSEQDKQTAIDAINDANTEEAITAANTTATTKNTVAEKAAKEEAKKELAKFDKLKGEEKTKAEQAIQSATSPDEIKTALEGAKKQDEENKKAEQAAQAADKYSISVWTPYNGTARTNVSESEAGKTITVTADPAPGYVVDKIVVRDKLGKELTLGNYKYKNYYNDYPYYPNSRWYRGYDYDDYIRWCDRNGYSRYNYSSFRTWCRRYGYSYDYDDFKRFCDWDDIYDYRWYNRYNYSYINQADFTMPASNVTVEVTFTSAPYYYDGYYYDSRTGTYRRYYDDDYYYYRYRRNKKSNYYERQAEEDKKEEETKVVEEKKNDTIVTKAVISIGSKMIDKVNDDLHTKRLMDAPAYVKDGRVMLPLRFVAEALGLQVSWIKDNRTVVIQDMLFRVEIPVDTNNITVNGITTTSDVKPEIVNGRVMLPIANIARALGLVDGRDIVWNAATKEVTLTRTITK